MKDLEKGRCSLFKEKENMIHVLTKIKRDNRDGKKTF
jgi:hypothetical protein